MNGLNEMAALIRQQRDTILSSWRRQVRQVPSARNLDTPTLNDHIPQLLDELADALAPESDRTSPEALAKGTSPVHGLMRFREGYDIGEVVAEYNILRRCVHDLAKSHGFTLESGSLDIINDVLDRAIGLAVQTYATERALELQKRREEYLAFVAHDLRTPLNAVAVAASVLEESFRDGNAREDTEWMLKTLRRNAQQLQELVEKIIQENTNISTESRIKLEPREFDLWPLVEALIYDLRPLAKTNGTPRQRSAASFSCLCRCQSPKARLSEPHQQFSQTYGTWQGRPWCSPIELGQDTRMLGNRRRRRVFKG